MKANAITRIVIFSIVIVLLMGLLAVGLGVGFLAGNMRNIFSYTGIQMSGMTDGTVASSGSVPANQIRNLEIDWVAGSIVIKPDDVDTISFAETTGLSENEQMVWKQSGDRLKIQFAREWPVFSFGFHMDHSKDLVVTVPRDWICNELDITSVSSRVEVSELKITDFDLENVSGRCTFTACTVDTASFTTVSGDVTFEGAVDNLDCESVSGNCNLTVNNTPRRIDMDSVSGDLIIMLPADTGFTASLDSVSGDISTEFPTTVSRGNHTYGDGHCRIDADTVSGNVIIREQK